VVIAVSASRSTSLCHRSICPLYLWRPRAAKPTAATTLCRGVAAGA
jgi:hypothetical protein